jgi:hypothetical protein
VIFCTLAPVSKLGGYRFVVVIGLGNEMKWRVLLELTEANGNVQTRELVTGHRPTNAMSPAAIGLTLAEGKSVGSGANGASEA